MRVRFGRMPNGDHFARTTLPLLGGSITLTARVTDAELRQMYRDNIGFRISFKSLGRAIGKIAKPATLLKITTMAAAIAANPTLAIKFGPKLLGDVRRGMAAKRVLTLAASGDERAKAIIARARASARTGAPAVAPGIDAGVMRYLVTVQRLSGAQTVPR